MNIDRHGQRPVPNVSRLILITDYLYKNDKSTIPFEYVDWDILQAL